MIDNFRNHSDDWSQVPSLPGGYGSDLEHAQIVNGFYSRQRPVPIIVTPGVSVGLTYVLWLFFGLFGVHYFYMGKPGVGILYLLTGGLLGVGWFVDLFTIKGQVARLNRR